jgi:hypothetical protein
VANPFRQPTDLGKKLRDGYNVVLVTVIQVAYIYIYICKLCGIYLYYYSKVMVKQSLYRPGEALMVPEV